MDVAELKQYVNDLPFFDTHSHMAGFDTGSPANDKAGKSLPMLILNDYLLYLVWSCADVAPPQEIGKDAGKPRTPSRTGSRFRRCWTSIAR